MSGRSYIDQDFAGAADIHGIYDSGNLSPSPTAWAALKCTAVAAGNPSWTIQVGGSPKAWGTGPNVDIAFLAQPGQKVRIVVTGMSPMGQVAGKIHGTGGDSLDAIDTNASAQSSVLSVGTQAFQAVLDRFDTSALSTKTYTIPAGVTSMGICVDFNETVATTPDPAHSVKPGSFILVGTPSGVNYLGVSPVASQAYWTTINDGDTAVTLITNAIIPNGCFLDVLTSPLVMTGQGGDRQGNLAVTEQFSLPARWQVPTANFPLGSGGIAPGGVIALIAPVAGTLVRLWQVHIRTGAGAAGSFGQLQDTAGTALRQMDFTVAADWDFEFNGLALPQGLGLQLKNTSAANSGSFNGGGSYDQT